MVDLEREIATFNRWLPSALISAPDRWCLIKGDTVIGTYCSEDAAFAEGVRVYGATGTFLVRQIVPEALPPHEVSGAPHTRSVGCHQCGGLMEWVRQLTQERDAALELVTQLERENAALRLVADESRWGS